MNQPIIVQQNIEIPATGASAGKPDLRSGSQARPVAAIIRPKARVNGDQGSSIRMDTTASVGSRPHIRTREFQEYVQWLQAKFQSDEAAESKSKPAVKKSPPALSDEQEQLVPVVAEIVSTLVAAPDASLPQSLFSTITTKTDESHELKSAAPTSQPTAAGVEPNQADQPTGVHSAKMERVDPPHAKLPKAYVSFDELKVGSNGMPTIRIATELANSNPVSTEVTGPKEFSATETDRFVATISKAIASVLTDAPELEFEQKVKDLFESELHARSSELSLLESPAEWVSPSPLEAPKASAAGRQDSGSSQPLDSGSSLPVGETNPEFERGTTEVMTSARMEIPTSVAAWDVEDFRWPVVTNQMIVAGSEALDQLCQSTLEMTSPGHQRVAIAGLGRGEGTTSIALSLARWAVARGKRVLVIDADLVSPGLTTQVGLAPSLSWINAISQSQDPSEVIVRSQKSNLCIMPLAQMVSRSTWPRFVYDSLGEIIEPIQSHFDLIILDVGPANQLMAELSRPSLLVDATLLVHNGVNSPEFQTTKSRLEMFGLNRFIVAQNRAHQQPSVNVA